MRSLPDILVLGGGGVLGEAWMMGVLAGIEDAGRVDFRNSEYFVGTSAGSIVAAHLVAGKRPRRPPSAGGARRGPLAAGPETVGLARVAARTGEWALAIASTFAPLALGMAAPGGALMRATLLRRLPRPPGTLDSLRTHMDTLGARFDGRLRVAAVDRNSGRRVVFGSPSAPRATVAEAVAASCCVPWLFAPVAIGDREYVDGGVWSPTNADAAPAGPGTHILCLNPTGSLSESNDAIGVFRRISRTAATVETLALRRRGAQVDVVRPSPGSASAMGINLMDRGPAARVLEAAYEQGLELGSER
jgi:NTE family protein